MKFTLAAGLSGPCYREILKIVGSLPSFQRDLPSWLYVDDRVRDPTPNWFGLIARASHDACAKWRPSHAIEVVPGSEIVIIVLANAFTNENQAISILEPLPFETCSLRSVFYDQWMDAKYRIWSFSRSHLEHGWGCAFRGTGHDRLVSRRWLDFGPWRVIRRPDDTTFIQFHDLAITDPAEAYEQAKVGHQRMGIDQIGGYIQGIDLDVIAEVGGVYRADEHTLDIVIAPGIAVSQQDMRVACGLRLYHRLTRPKVDRIEAIAYVFADKADAQEHLHELWLRELECWYLDERGKHRLDADYHPMPDPPAWVKALEHRRGR
jgi:hypothetical protein